MHNAELEALGQPPSYMRQLDGLRAIAVLAVMLSHWVSVNQLFHVGLVGVRLFFVLSGFLITGILLRLKASIDGATRLGRGPALKHFYARRSIRIFPLYYAMLLACLFYHRTDPNYGEVAVYHTLYLTNFLAAMRESFVPGNHFWSLAVEEQFYLIWPMVILMVPFQRLRSLFFVLIALGPISRLLMFSLGFTHYTYNYLPWANLDFLVCGALLALVPRVQARPLSVQRLCPRWLLPLGVTLCGTLLLLLGLAALASSGQTAAQLPSGLDQLASGYRQVLFPFGVALVCMWCVGGASRGFQGWGARLLTQRAVVYLGTISYGIYIVHPFVGGFYEKLDPGQGLLSVLARMLLSIGVASVSWFAFEKPINKLKARFSFGKLIEEAQPSLGPAGNE